jgi:hypothetical protein
LVKDINYSFFGSFIITIRERGKMYFNIYTLTEENNFTEVFLYYGGDWDWSAIGVYFSSEKNRYFWFVDGGCSCSSFGDSMSGLGDFCDGDKFAAAKAIHEFVEREDGPAEATAQAAKFLVGT